MKLQSATVDSYFLNWAVAKAEGFEPSWDGSVFVDGTSIWEPDYNAEQAATIIFREKINLRWDAEGKVCTASLSRHRTSPFPGFYVERKSGPTAQVASMRCWVSQKLGAMFDMPDELARMLAAAPGIRPDQIPPELRQAGAAALEETADAEAADAPRMG